MECPRWIEDGLLFTAGELLDSRKKEYEHHVEGCEFCRKEIAEYFEMKRSFFNDSILLDEPDAAIDDAILRACSKPMRMSSISAGVMLFIKKTTIATFFLCVGFIGIAYYAYVINDAKEKAAELRRHIIAGRNISRLRAAPSQESGFSATSSPVLSNVTVPDKIGSLQNDSTKADSNIHRLSFSQTRGNIGEEGVQTVGTLQKK